MQHMHRVHLNEPADWWPQWAWAMHTVSDALDVPFLARRALRYTVYHALEDASFLPVLGGMLALYGSIKSRLQALRSGLRSCVRGAYPSEALLAVLLIQLAEVGSSETASAPGSGTELSSSGEDGRAAEQPCSGVKRRRAGSLEGDELDRAQRATNSAAQQPPAATAAAAAPAANTSSCQMQPLQLCWSM